MKFFPRYLTTVILLFSAMALNAQTRNFDFNTSAPSEGLTVGQSTRSGLTMRHTLKHLEISNITDNGYTGDVVQGGTGIVLPTAPPPTLK